MCVPVRDDYTVRRRRKKRGLYALNCEGKGVDSTGLVGMPGIIAAWRSTLNEPPRWAPNERMSDRAWSFIWKIRPVDLRALATIYPERRIETLLHHWDNCRWQPLNWGSYPGGCIVHAAALLLYNELERKPSHAARRPSNR